MAPFNFASVFLVLAAATREERVRMAIIGFGLARFAMIFGIILFAAGLKVGIAHSTGLRLVIVALMLTTIPLGISLGALVQVGIWALLIVALWVSESRQAGGDAR